MQETAGTHEHMTNVTASGICGVLKADGGAQMHS
jgi:hypothetical protein